MPALVQCPSCPARFRAGTEQLGRVARCVKCGTLFRLATPVGVLLDEDRDLDTPQVVEEPAAEPRPAPLPLPDDDDEPDAVRHPQRRAWVLPAVLVGFAFALLVPCGVGGFFLVRHLTAPEEVKPDAPVVAGGEVPRAAATDPPPAAPAPAPAPGTSDPPPAAPPTRPAGADLPPAPRLAAPTVLHLPGPVSDIHTGGGGRYVLFRISSLRQLVTYDAVARRVVGTIAGVDQNTLIAVGQNKLVLGRAGNGRFIRIDIRTGVQETVVAADLPHLNNHMAIGSGSDGPLVVVAQAGNKFQARLYDLETFAQLGQPIDDPARPGRSFPLTMDVGVSHVAVSGDGRVISLGDRLYFRTPDGYRAVPVNPSGGLRPTPDGQTALGNSFVSDRGAVFPFGDRVARWFLPAAGGPFFASAEYGPGAGKGIRLRLHADQDPHPLGDLPGSDVVTEWSNRRVGSVGSLHRYLAVLPEPGLVVFAPAGARDVHILPLDLPALLTKHWRGAAFTSVPPGVAGRDRPYSYTATGITREGTQPTFKLEAGPPGMAITPDGRLTWVPGPSSLGTAADVRLTARGTGGKEAVQRFQVIVPARPDSPVGSPPVAIRPPDAPPPVAQPPVAQPPPVRPPVVRPAPPPVNPAPPAMAAAPAAATVVVKLPGSVGAVAVGGAGRYVCLYLPATRQVAVFDATQGKVVKYLPVGGTNALIAAGTDKLFIVLPGEPVVQRWDLKTFEKELTAPLPEKWVLRSAHIGSAATGPLWLAGGSSAAALDTRTLRPITLNWDNQQGQLPSVGEGVRVSADGRTIGSWGVGVSPAGLRVLTLTDKTVKGHYEHDTVGHVAPGPDGRVMYTGVGRFTPDGKPIGQRDGERGQGPRGTAYAVPAAEGTSLYLNITHGPAAAEARPGQGGRPQLAVHWAADGRKLADLPDVVVEDPNARESVGVGNDQRFMLLPSARLLVALPPTNDRLLLYPFDLDALLEKTGQDYLLVDAPPGAPAVRGQPFTQALTIKSKKGGVRVKVDSGPDGLTAAPDGKVSWAVPKDFADDEAVAVLTVSDASGQEVLQTLRIAVGGEKVAPVAADPKKGPPVAAAPDPPADDEPTTVQLPGAVRNVVVGAGGRLLILHLPQQRQLAVFDPAQGKVVKYLPAAEDGISIAAGQEHLFVANPTARVLQRYSLKTFEKEATVAQPVDGTVTGLCMGSASKGPLLICTKGDQWGGKVALVDPITLKVIPGGDQLPVATAAFVRASADGRVFGWRNGTGSEGHDMSLVEVADGRAKGRTFGAATSLILPGPDGRYLYCGEGVFNAQFKKLHPPEGNNPFTHPFLPAASGSLFVQLEPAGDKRFIVPDPLAPPGLGRVHFFLPGQYRPFAAIDKVEGVTGESYGYGSVREPLMHDKRVHLLPAAGRLVTIPASGDKLVLRRFSLDDLLAKSGTDYLLVTSEPPAEAARGVRFAYAPVVRSKKGGVKLKIDSGPAGMMLADGQLVWEVPADFEDKDVDVILTISDATGQEMFQAFKLAVRDRKPGDADAPAAAPVPSPAPAKDPPPAQPAPAVPKAAATLGDIRPTPLKGNSAEVALPAAAADLCLGGGGRLIIFHLPTTRQLAVFDVNEGKIVKYLPAPGEGLKFAAGRDKLFVVVPSARVIQRWDLATLEKEVTAPLAADGDVKALLLGHASRGPLFVGLGEHARFAKAPSVFLDQKTLKPVEVKAEPFHGMLVDDLRASADGSVVVGRSDDWRGSVSAAVGGNAVRMWHHESAGAYLGGPSADGRFLYGTGVWTTELKPVEGAAREQVYLPAAHGPFFFSGRAQDKNTPARMEYYVAGQTRPFATTDLPPTGPAGAGLVAAKPGGMPLTKRGIWVPAAKLFVVVGLTDDRLYLSRLDPEELLKNSPIDYLVVLSAPPAAVRGQPFRYTPEVQSKKGGVKLKLDAGPDGMRLADGTLTWAVPKDFTGEADVILTVSDASGQETFHTFKLAPADPPGR